MKIMRGPRWICDLIRPIRPKRWKVSRLRDLKVFQSVPLFVPGRIEGGPEVEKGTLIDAHWR
jgi:hypothetical protein